MDISTMVTGIGMVTTMVMGADDGLFLRVLGPLNSRTVSPR